MDEENIYEDLDNFILDHQVGQVQENNKELQQTIEKLEQTTKKFHEEISELKNINQNLERNISALFKTAKSEIERKDKQISELRRQLDNLKFRRGGNKKGQKCEPNNEDTQKEIEQFKCVIEQKNRIIQSLTKELESVKKEFSSQEKLLKRNASHFEDDDLRSRLSKKRKVDDKCDYKRDKSRRPRSRSKSRDSRFDSRLKSRFDKKRTIRRNRSGSFEKRRSSIIEKHRNKYENTKYSKSRSRSPTSRKKYNNQLNEKSSRNHSQIQERNNKLRSHSRSSSIDWKKYHKHSEKALADRSDKKCEKKVVHHNQLIKEDSGMSSSNSHTSELLLKCDEVKADLLEDLKVEDLEEGEIDCTLEDINSEEDNVYFKEKVVSLKKENTRKTSKDINIKLDKKEMKKSNELNERPKKIMENKSELENIIICEKELRPAEKENINMETTINTNKITETRLELVTNKTAMVKANDINDDLKGSHDVLELMVQSNYLDDLDIDEEIIKMQRIDDDKRKKRKEDKQRISNLRTAISECKQNIELLEHNFYSDGESETEDEFNKTASCIEENSVNTKQNNLVLKISKGSIVKSNVEPKIVNLKDDIKHKQIVKIDDVVNKNQLETNSKQEIVDNIDKQIQNEDLDKNFIDTNKKKKQNYFQKPDEILVKNTIDTNKKEHLKAKIQKSNISDKHILDKKEITNNVNNKSDKEIQKIDLKNSKDSSELRLDKDNQIKKNKSSEDDNRKKRINTNEKCTRTTPSSKHENPEKINTSKSIKTNSSNLKTEAYVQDKLKCTKTESVELQTKLTEKIPADELLKAISNIVDDVKTDGTKCEQNFTNITNLESAVSQGQNKKPVIDDTHENKLNEIADVENEKKENVSLQVNDNDKVTLNVTKSRENETERKPPLKARRRRAFICIT